MPYVFCERMKRAFYKSRKFVFFCDIPLVICRRSSLKKIAIFGSTGSIGTQTTQVVDSFSNCLDIRILSAHSNTDLLLEQIRRYRPSYVFITDKKSFSLLSKEEFEHPIRFFFGWNALSDVLKEADIDVAIGAISGFAGILPTLICIEHGLRIGLANKETLVAGGDLVAEALRRHPEAKIIPVDSEHSAIFQCLEEGQEVDKIILTASGGPFHSFTREQLKKVGLKEALKHPNWSMGQKITIDSATLMNKGLEVIEAQRLFGVDYDDIEVVIHPQSIVHSMVQYKDGSILAQLGRADMRLPIQYSIFYPDRQPNFFERFDWSKGIEMNFKKPDIELFPALSLAYDVGRKGRSVPCVMNAANEVAVHSFLKEEISFLQIVEIVEEVTGQFVPTRITSLDQLIALDEEVRAFASAYIRTHCR